MLPLWRLNHNWAFSPLLLCHSHTTHGLWRRALCSVDLQIVWVCKRDNWINKLMMSLIYECSEWKRWILFTLPVRKYQQSRAYTRRPSFVPTDWLTDVWLQDVVKLSSYSWILGLQAVTGPYQSRACRQHSRVSGSLCSDSLIIVHLYTAL